MIDPHCGAARFRELDNRALDISLTVQIETGHRLVEDQ